MQIRQGDILFEFILRIEINDLRQDAKSSVQIGRRLGSIGNGHTDDDIGTHLLGNVGGEVITHTAVNKYQTVDTYRREDSWDRHRGSHSLWQMAAMEIHLGITGQIGSHTGERNGQGIEVKRVVIPCTEFLQQQLNVLARDEAAVAAAALAESQTTGEDIRIMSSAVGYALPIQVLTVGYEIVPIQSTHQRVKGLGIVADGIKAPHQTAHRGARDDVDRQSCLLNHFQCSDMGDTLGSTATQHDGHLLALAREKGHHGQRSQQ